MGVGGPALEKGRCEERGCQAGVKLSEALTATETPNSRQMHFYNMGRGAARKKAQGGD